MNAASPLAESLCCVVVGKTLYPLAQSRKIGNRPDMTEQLMTAT